CGNARCRDRRKSAALGVRWRMPGADWRPRHTDRWPASIDRDRGGAGWQRLRAWRVGRTCRGSRHERRSIGRGFTGPRGARDSGSGRDLMKVYLIGAGPGDPELITVKGRRILQQAGAILFDHLAPEALLDLAPANAERIYVGKKKSAHAFSQEEICEMLIEHARRGQCVVRLKGGDPYVFGRGGEEAEALAAAGIPFEVVPGVPTPVGLAAYSGVPLTHREHTSAVTFVTGHSVEAIDWSKVGH